MPTDPITLTRTKYSNVPTTVDGYTFDSKAEANRCAELTLLQRGGVITDLTIHPRWDLVVNGVKVGVYEGDFVYTDVASGKLVIEDVKGVRTPVYRIKRKLMLAVHGLTITEVDA